MVLVPPWHVKSSRTRDWMHVPYTRKQILIHYVTREVYSYGFYFWQDGTLCNLNRLRNSRLKKNVFSFFFWIHSCAFDEIRESNIEKNRNPEIQTGNDAQAFKTPCVFPRGLAIVVTWIRKQGLGTSLAVQWLRLCDPMHGEWIWSLVGELRSHSCCC